VENSALEDYIQRCYAETDAAVQSGRVELD
jgi:hypothetical protein